MTIKEAYGEISYRLLFCANLYGSRWREEDDFLKACEEVFKKYFDALPKDGDEIPDDFEKVVVTVTGWAETGETTEFREDMVMIGFYDPDLGWQLSDESVVDFEVTKWQRIISSSETESSTDSTIS